MIVLVGESGSGKTTQERRLTKRGYKKGVSLTSRAKREGEVEGVDYKYRTKEEILKMKEDGKLVEIIEYLGNIYALEAEEVRADGVVVVEPEGLKQLREIEGLDITVYYLKLSERAREQRMRYRGDTEKSIKERIEKDRRHFQGVSEMADHILEVDKLSKSELTERIIEIEGKTKIG